MQAKPQPAPLPEGSFEYFHQAKQPAKPPRDLTPLEQMFAYYSA